MKNKTILRRILYAALIVFFFLHNDLWYWDNPRLIFGLPVGLLYHIVYCMVAALLMYLLVTHAWPKELEIEEDGEADR